MLEGMYTAAAGMAAQQDRLQAELPQFGDHKRLAGSVAMPRKNAHVRLRPPRGLAFSRDRDHYAFVRIDPAARQFGRDFASARFEDFP